MTMKPEENDRAPMIARNLQRMNKETSLRLGSAAGSDAKPPRTGRMRILSLAFGAFGDTYFMKKNFVRGKEGFIISWAAALEALVQAVKEWELAFRRAEGAERLPPASEAEVMKLSSRYASWTSS